MHSESYGEKVVELQPGGGVADAYAHIINGIGEDLGREGLRDTPQRAAKAM